MNPEKSRLEWIAEIIAEDMLELYEQGFQQFPIDSHTLIDALPEETLIRIKNTLEKHIVHGNVPLGYVLLFLMPRKIPVEEKKGFFKKTVNELYEIREDFSQRTGVRIKRVLYNLPENWEEIDIEMYKKLVFLLDNLNELNIPVFRGWGFDTFSFGRYTYRVYNTGTIKKPSYLFMKAEGKDATADVFGHIKSPEIPVKAWVSKHVEPDDLLSKFPSGELGNVSERVEFVMDRWSEFLETRLPKTFDEVKERTDPRLYEKDVVLKNTKRYILGLLK